MMAEEKRGRAPRLAAVRCGRALNKDLLLYSGAGAPPLSDNRC